MAVEFRHPEWFEGGAQAEEIWARLRDLGMGAVISDTARRGDALHMRVTALLVLVRFGGYEGHASDETRLAHWAQRIAEWKDQGLTEFHSKRCISRTASTPQTLAGNSHGQKQHAGLDVQAPTDLRAATQGDLFS